MTDFTIILRSLSSRMFSTVTTVITVAVAVGLMLVLLSMRDSGRRAFERGVGDMHLLVSRDNSPLVSVLNGIFYANPPQRAIEWSKYMEIADGPRTGPLLDYAIPNQQGDSYRGFPVLATTVEFFTALRPDIGRPWRLQEGRFFEKPFEVVLGADSARVTGARIGDVVHLTHGAADAPGAHVHKEFSYTIVGVLAATGGAHDRAIFTDLIGSWIIHAHDRRLQEDPSVKMTTEADLVEADRLITGVYLRAATRPGSETSPVMPQLASELRRDPTLTVASPKSEIDSLFKIVSNIDQILLGMAAVVMVSSGIAIMLALYNSMEQRRRQIAVLRVLGASRGRIFSLIVTESAVLGILGAAVGFALFLAGGQVVSQVMRERLGLVITPTLGLEWTLVVVVATVALASAAGVVPAVMAYRTSVARSLRPLG